MSNNPKIEPLELRAPKGARVMEIDWADGHAGVYPHDILRGYCPCAHCQGHQGPIEFHPGGDLELETIEEVGTYALRLAWADGHGTGIYAFPYLRELCSCGVCAGEKPRGRVFGR